MQEPETTRYELKVAVNSSMLSYLRSWLRLHPAGFHIAYSSRLINNIYFDTPHLESFAEILSGVTARRKVRLRWYGENIVDFKGVFEVKHKRNMRRWKETYPVSNCLDLTNKTWPEIIAAIRSELPEQFLLFLMSTSSPTLINRYRREYYVTLDGAVRVTLDYSQMVYDQRYSAFPNLTFSMPSQKDMVVEFKANTEHRDRLAAITETFPLRVGKNSKYANGVEAMVGY